MAAAEVKTKKKKIMEQNQQPPDLNCGLKDGLMPGVNIFPYSETSVTE